MGISIEGGMHMGMGIGEGILREWPEHVFGHRRVTMDDDEHRCGDLHTS